MTKAVIDSINFYVKEDDTLYHLGDWTFGGIDKIWTFRKEIKCKNVHLVCGNHDEHIKKNKEIKVHINEQDLLENFDICEDFNRRFEGYSHLNLQELFSSVQNYLEIKINKKIFVLSHFPIQEWYEMDRGSIHLHGHCHHMLDEDLLNVYNKRMDVGIDWEEFRPYSLDEILEKMKDRECKRHIS